MRYRVMSLIWREASACHAFDLPFYATSLFVSLIAFRCLSRAQLEPAMFMSRYSADERDVSMR